MSCPIPCDGLLLTCYLTEHFTPTSTGYSKPSLEMIPNNPLIWTEPVTSNHLKRKLAIFQPSTDKAMKRSGAILAAKLEIVHLFEKVLNSFGDVCGWCHFYSVTNATNHAMEDCTLANPDQKKLYQRFTSMVYYDPKKPKPCYTCHVFSFGGDQLHKPIVENQPSCTYPNLILPLVFAAHQFNSIRCEAQREFKPKISWDTLQGFAQWLVLPHKAHGTNCMSLTKFLYERSILDSE